MRRQKTKHLGGKSGNGPPHNKASEETRTLVGSGSMETEKFSREAALEDAEKLHERRLFKDAETVEKTEATDVSRDVFDVDIEIVRQEETVLRWDG